MGRRGRCGWVVRVAGRAEYGYALPASCPQFTSGGRQSHPHVPPTLVDSDAQCRARSPRPAPIRPSKSRDEFDTHGGRRDCRPTSTRVLLGTALGCQHACNAEVLSMADDAERMARIGAAKELVRLITERMATIDPAVRDMYTDQEADELGRPYRPPAGQHRRRRRCGPRRRPPAGQRYGRPEPPPQPQGPEFVCLGRPTPTRMPSSRSRPI